MADKVTIDSLNTQFDDLQAAVVKEQADVKAYIDSLKAQVAAGTAVTQEQLDALSAKATGIKDMVTQFDINNSQPAVTPAPLPPTP